MPVFGARGGHPGPQQNLHRRKLTKAQSRGCGKLHHFLRECWAVPPLPQGESWHCCGFLVSWWVLGFLMWSLSGSFGVTSCHQPARRVSQAILCNNHRVHISKERCGGWEVAPPPPWQATCRQVIGTLYLWVSLDVTQVPSCSLDSVGYTEVYIHPVQISLSKDTRIFMLPLVFCLVWFGFCRRKGESSQYP